LATVKRPVRAGVQRRNSEYIDTKRTTRRGNKFKENTKSNMGLCASTTAMESSPGASNGPDVVNCVLLGSAGVGKTNLCECKINNSEFNREYAPSEGMDLYPLGSEDRQMRIFCHSGMGRMTVGTAYFKSASYFIFMYDVCDLRSFKECQNLLNHVVRHGPSERPPIYMIANKIDEYADPAWASQKQWEPPGLAPENGDMEPTNVMNRTKTTERSRQVTTEQGQVFCDEHDIEYFEMSVEKGTGVDDFFDKLYKILQPPVVSP